MLSHELQRNPGLRHDGLTGTVLLAESHLAIHTWPESGFVTLDVYGCSVHIADGFNFIKSSTDRYDLIILDLTDPGGPSTPLYTAGFYEGCAARLKSGGILGLHIASPFAQPQRIVKTLTSLKQAFDIVRPYMVTVPLSGGPWMMACASNTLDPAKLAATAVDTRMSTRCVTGLQFYNGSTHCAAMALPNFVRATVLKTGACL